MLIEKTFLFLICFLLHFSHADIDSAYIIIVLTALAATGLGSLNDSDKQYSSLLSAGITALYFAVALFIPDMYYYIPLIFTDSVRNQCIPCMLLCASGIIINSTDFSTVLMLFLLCAVAYIFVHNAQTIKSLTKRMYTLYDTSTETQLLIQAKNKALLENQDNKIMMATLQERNRIAREIHDNVGHTLTRSILQTGAIKALNRDESLKASLNELQDSLNNAMTSIRSSVHDLHDESVNLKSAIEDIIHENDKLNIKLEYDLNDYMPRNIKYSFIAIIKEAVNNCLRHSNADTMIITAREHPGFYQLCINDNGTTAGDNIPDGALLNTVLYNNGIGLSNMRDRVNNLGGNITFSASNGFGILITIIKQKEDEITLNLK